MTGAKRHRRSVYLDETQWAALSEVAKSEDRSVNSIVRRAVGEFLMKQTDWATYRRDADGEPVIVEEHFADLVPEPLGPDVRTTDEPVLPALKREEP